MASTKYLPNRDYSLKTQGRANKVSVIALANTKGDSLSSDKCYYKENRGMHQ